jgi:hypothetical protein
VKPLAAVTYFDRTFKLPQTFKASLGADQRVSGGVVLSADVLYQRGVDEPYITDDNLRGPITLLSGEGGRVMYGTVGATSTNGALPTVTPAKVSTAFGPILRNSSRSGDRSLTVVLQAQKRFAQVLEFTAAYAHTRAEDQLSLRDAQTVSNYGFVPVNGTLEDRALVTSVFSVPDKVTLSGTANLAAGFTFSVIYLGQSGLPYTYVVNGDANGDGVGNLVAPFDRQQNDAVYVPRNPTNIALVRDSGAVLVADPVAAAALDGFISGQSCLQRARGIIMPRNSCRNPWINQLNARAGKTVQLSGRHRAEVTLDVFNLLHLLNDTWGLVRQTGTFAGAGTENVPLLKLRGHDGTFDRNLYQLTLPAHDAINVDASRWRLQLGARYSF